MATTFAGEQPPARPNR